MAYWTEGRSITDWTDQREVEKLLALLPISESGELTHAEITERRIAVINLFGIAAVSREGGISFGSGVSVQDQPLLAALNVLVTRRFPLSPAAR